MPQGVAAAMPRPLREVDKAAMWKGLRLVVVPVLAFGLAGCVGTTYIDEGAEPPTFVNPLSKVYFRVTDAYRESPPACVAILPFEAGESESPVARSTRAIPAGRPKAFEAGESGSPVASSVTPEVAETVRRTIYAYMSPLGTVDVELPRIDYVLNQLSDGERRDLALVGDRLDCDALVFGEVTEYSSQFLGLYARVAVGAHLKMVRARDGALLWEARHVAQKHKLVVSLSPIGLALGVVRAASGLLDEEQFTRVTGDLARRLCETIPDTRLAVLDRPRSPPSAAAEKDAPAGDTAQALLDAMAYKPVQQRKAALEKALEEHWFGDAGTSRLYEALITLAPEEPASHLEYARYLAAQGRYPEALHHTERALERDDQAPSSHFLKASILAALGKLEAADSALVDAIALDDTKAEYFTGLGYVSAVKGDLPRALAAYRMTLDRDPLNGFAYYNIGLILFREGDLEGATEALHSAGLAYIAAGQGEWRRRESADLQGFTVKDVGPDYEFAMFIGALLRGEGETLVAELDERAARDLLAKAARVDGERVAARQASAETGDGLAAPTLHHRERIDAELRSQMDRAEAAAGRQRAASQAADDAAQASMALAALQTQIARASERLDASRPEGSGRRQVRAIRPSISHSHRMLSAPEVPAPTAMQSNATTASTG